ncbi:DUF5076 domain-containing protein [Luteolibacter flavescens]|uniref:DUF5076 domain-containing protein n=1 Tax=Luteolibacter flavescens TaxID=1859460 RepID=A0ABT3FWQ8_9BACT|nr:DUF5076 domain-containing protein [Luteolibacter flavescens]MCW1887659.1 DUF5076 domain-containing protein [Luteolibacter flavescens]
MNELDPPYTVAGDPKATEMLRLWAAHGKLNVSINIGCYEEAGHDESEAWGVILADAARHVANALSQRYGASRETELSKIRATFLAELVDPSSEVEGH